MVVPPQINGIVLISESDLEGVESGDGVINAYAAFRSLKPVAILQGVYVYQGNFAVPLASAWVDVRHSADAAQEGDVTPAFTPAQRAVMLAPKSARTQLQLANVFTQAKQWDAALQHYQLARKNLLNQRPDLEQEELGPHIQSGMTNAKIGKDNKNHSGSNKYILLGPIVRGNPNPHHKRNFGRVCSWQISDTVVFGAGSCPGQDPQARSLIAWQSYRRAASTMGDLEMRALSISLHSWMVRHQCPQHHCWSQTGKKPLPSTSGLSTFPTTCRSGSGDLTVLPCVCMPVI